jgi:hypothetical protein
MSSNALNLGVRHKGDTGSILEKLNWDVYMVCKQIADSKRRKLQLHTEEGCCAERW